MWEYLIPLASVAKGGSLPLFMTHNMEKFLKFGRSTDAKGSEPLPNLNLINTIFLDYAEIYF